MSKRFDELFEEIADILRRDWAGFSLAGERLDLKYYNQSIGQAWKDGKLDELLFLRHISQMLACTGDRHLRLALRPSDTYAPMQPGFFARRYENALYITAVNGDDRLRVGDRIDAINGGTPAEHRKRIQKNFFYADTPEREDWLGLLRMAETIHVTHANGSNERLELRSFSPAPAQSEPRVITSADGLIIDVRNLSDMDEMQALYYLSYICRADTSLSKLTDTEIYVNYTRRNCLIKTAALQGMEDAEDYIAELREKSGRGFLFEDVGNDDVLPGFGDKPAVVLIDTWTRGAAESFALSAQRAGAKLVGRPTLGTLDLCGDVSYELDERYVLTWPTAITKSAKDSGVFGQGVQPDRYIPFTPAECKDDAVLRAASDYLREIK